jgi:hypothetical protein
MKGERKGKSWLLPLSSEFHEKSILSALQSNEQKGFANCALMIAENIYKKKLAILHLKKPIRKGQVDGLCKVKSQKIMGDLCDIERKLRGRGYTMFRSLKISGPEMKTRTPPTTKPMQRDSPQKDKHSTIAGNHCEFGTVEELAELHSELLQCLRDDAGLHVSGCPDISRTVQMIRNTIQGLMLDSKILVNDIQNLKDVAKQKQSKIEALHKKDKVRMKAHEANLEIAHQRSADLKASYDDLYSHYINIKRRESETLQETRRRIEEWRK